MLRLFSFMMIFLIFFKSVFFLQTYYGVCFFHILSFYLFLLQISLYIYLWHAFSIFLYHFHNKLLLYLVSRFCFSDNKSSHSIFIYNKKKLQNTFFINQIRIVYYANCIIFALIPKVNFVSTSLNINNSNIMKTYSFLH